MAIYSEMEFLMLLRHGDKLCFGVRCIGIFCDGVGLFTNIVPGFSATSLITTPVSVGCKAFVAKCKQSPNNPFCIKL